MIWLQMTAMTAFIVMIVGYLVPWVFTLVEGVLGVFVIFLSIVALLLGYHLLTWKDKNEVEDKKKDDPS